MLAQGASRTILPIQGGHARHDEAARVSFFYRQRLDYLVSDVPCTTCQGSRLRDYAAACHFQGHTIGELCGWSLRQTYAFFEGFNLTKDQQQIAGELLREIQNRLQFLVDVGLDYLTLEPIDADACPAANRNAFAWPARSAAA